MKKVIGMILCLVMLGSLSMFGLTGCGDKYDLYVAALNGGYGKAHWEELTKEFEKQTGKKVKLVAESNVEDIIDPQLKAGNGPDVIYLAKGRPKKLTETLMSSGKIMDISGLLSENVKDGKKFSEVIAAQSLAGVKETNGKTFMLPLFVGLNGLFYNADKFYANDGDGTYDAVKDGKYELPATWDEFLAMGATLTGANDPDLFTYPTAGYMDAFIPSSIASSAGIAKLDKAFAYEDGIWEDEQVNAIFKKLEALKPYVYEKCVAQATPADFKKNQQALIDGDVLFMCNGDWVKDEMKATTPPNFNWGTMPALAFENGGTRYTSAAVEQVYISKDTKQEALAKDFLKFVYSDKGQQIIADKSNNAIVATTNYATLAKDLISESILDGYKGYLSGTTQAIDTNRFPAPDTTKLPPDTPGWNAIMCEKLTDVWGGNYTATAWIAELERISDLYRAAT